MSGFDNSTQQSGVFAQAKQLGSILRGIGAPVPTAGVFGDVYVDTQNWVLYNKRASDGLDPWGHYIFAVPPAYQTQLKWFSSSAPSDDIGAPGDYCLLWGGFANYGVEPLIYGPKTAGNKWPENGNGPDLVIAAAGAGFVTPVGLTGEGAPIADSPSTQLIVVGLTDEYILPWPVTAIAGSPVTQQGLQSGPAAVDVNVNPIYSATDQHQV